MFKILTVAEHYLPSHKAGGPVRSISNTIDALGNEFEYIIVTSDRDLGDSQPFDFIKGGQWIPVGRAQVLYLAPCEKRLVPWKRLLNSLQYDLIYLNSFFSTLTVMTLFLRRFGLIANKPILIAVRGELGHGALEIKWFKKKVYLFITKIIGFYEGVKWHASSEYELAELLFVLGIPKTSAFISFAPVYVAPDLPRVAPDFSEEKPPISKQPGSARIIFLSRIARKKNLDIALKLLSGMKGRIDFDIYGPLEDQSYWKECQKIIKHLPPDIVVKYGGTVNADDVGKVFSRYHLFLFPTRNENFGHVILEAFCAGCLVLTSNTTAWRGLEAKRVGWDLPLTSPESYRNALRDVLDMDAAEFEERSMLARQFGHDFANNPMLVRANRSMFLHVLNDSQ
jgi:glycosyltransferase involved in cell wall biosynthesis